MSEQFPQRCYEFGPFRLDAGEGQLWRDGEEIQLTQKSFKVLTLLVENGGHVLDKNELIEKVWPDAFVEENRLADNISTLRKLLGDDPKAPSYIKTVPGRGYRFVADVREVQDGAVAVIEQTRTHLVIEEERETPAIVSDLARGTLGKENIALAQLSPRPSSRHLNSVLIAIGGVLIAALAFAAYFVLKDKAKTTSSQIPLARSIAVLPFKPLVSSQGDPALEWGLTDALIARLTNIRQITVRPTSSVMKYTSEGQDLRAAGSELNVDVLLDGKVQKADDRIRLSVQLVRASDGTPLWAEKFDEKFTDIFAVQDAISRRVADALALKLGGEEKARLAKRDTTSSDAYQLYLNGLYFFNKFTPADHRKAAEYFQQAIDKDPGYALAHAGLADTFGASATNGWLPPQEAYPKAMASARKAVELDGTLAEAHSSLGGLNMFYELNWTTAEQEFNRAAELDVRCLSAYKLFSYLLVATGRLDEGVMKAKRGLELDPVAADLSEDVAAALYYSRRYDESIAQWQKSLELEPHRANAHFALGITYEQKGMYQEAFAEYQTAISLSERTSQFLGQLGHAYAVSGKRTEALKILHELQEMSRHRHVAPYDLAILYTGLGEREKAIEQLNKAYEERSGFIIYLGVEPQFDPLRSDPRYAELLRRMNLSP